MGTCGLVAVVLPAVRSRAWVGFLERRRVGLKVGAIVECLVGS